MTCQKSKSKLGNRRVRLDPAISLKNVGSVFDCGNHGHSQIVRGRKIKQPPCFVCYRLSVIVTHVYRSYLRDVLILVASAIDREYLGI